tara:strand:- start:30 stop:1166 length:1137 start_codon:yes stop_codon:yes gene_type:complete
MNKDITNQPLETKYRVEGTSAEVELREMEFGESHANAALLNKIRGAFMKTCGSPDKNIVDTEELSKPKAIVACAMEWKNVALTTPMVAMIRNPIMAKVLKDALSTEELQTIKAYLKTLGDDDSADLRKVAKAVLTFGQGTQETTNWKDVESADRTEYSSAKTKKEWEKIDKKELDRDSKKEKEEHEKDAVKDDDSKIKKLKKGKPSEKKDVEIHDLKKDQELDKENKIKYTKADDAPWEKTDEKELKEDTKKQKKEHEKDAVKDDKKQIKDLKKDIKEDKKDEKKAKAADYSKYWDYVEDYAEERYDGKTRSELKDSVFLDPKRRSFPVVNCRNVRAAVSTWGMYKGSMSFDEFKRKLTSRAKKLGCESSLPDSWKDE